MIVDPSISPVLYSLSAGDNKRIDGQLVAQAAHLGDCFALEVRDEMAAALSSGVASVINSLNPERVVLGGTVFHGFPRLYDMVVDGATASCLKPARSGLSIVPASLKDLAGVVGAATRAMGGY
jgi:glucokinase